MTTVTEMPRWHAKTVLRKYNEAGDLIETVESEDNLLMYGGASLLWECLLGNGGSGSLQYMNAANAYIGVGNGTTTAAATQTDLVGGSKLRKGMDSGWPKHTDGTSSTNASVEFQASFQSSDANFAWQEWGLFNASSGGRMLSRKVESFGTKASGSVWVLTITISQA